MIRREDIKPGAEFVSSMDKRRTVLAVGERKAFCKAWENGIEFTVDIDHIVSLWNYPPKPKIAMFAVSSIFTLLCVFAVSWSVVAVFIHFLMT